MVARADCWRTPQMRPARLARKLPLSHCPSRVQDLSSHLMSTCPGSQGADCAGRPHLGDGRQSGAQAGPGPAWSGPSGPRLLGHAIRQRARRRRETLLGLLTDIAARAASEGVDIRVFGSVARGTAGPASDLDILVTGGFVPENRFRIMSWIQEKGADRDIPVDVAFLDMAPHLMSGAISCSDALHDGRNSHTPC